jgi:hypothetical protein
MSITDPETYRCRCGSLNPIGDSLKLVNPCKTCAKEWAKVDARKVWKAQKFEELKQERLLLPRPMDCKVDEHGYVLCCECGDRRPPWIVSTCGYITEDAETGKYAEEECFPWDEPYCSCHERSESEERDAPYAEAERQPGDYVKPRFSPSGARTRKGCRLHPP